MKLFLKKSGQEVFAFPWVAETARPWDHHHTRVYLPVGKHKSGLIGHMYIVRNDSLRKEE